jgi:HTH-type transcriptional regulator, transcriptional repressor of NAD biosynthesis genes
VPVAVGFERREGVIGSDFSGEYVEHMKQFRSAVVFGKFWPLHLGHLRLIGEAVTRAERVIVVVDDGSEDVPTAVRAAWVAETFPSVEVATAPDLCGHDSTECTPACSEKYAIWLSAAHGPVDAVFSGEAYGAVLASELGAVSVRLDRNRLAAAGREIRADTVGHWDLLSGAARAWYCRRVVVVGAESTGTSTLAADLAEHLGTIWVPEYGRQFSAEHGLGHNWSSRDFEEIAQRQAVMEDAAATRSGPVLVCDTDVLATALWHERYMGKRSAVVETIASERRPCLYVLTAHEIPFVQDGLRDGEHLRGWMTGRFREVLADTGVPWVQVQGNRQQRVEQAARAIALHCVLSTTDSLAPYSGTSEPHQRDLGARARRPH